MRAWTLDPAQNGGYPSFGVSVWFVSNLTGVENGFSALPVGGKAEAYAPTATGYDFVGWYTDEALTEAFDFTQPVTEDTVLYAKWTLHVCTPGACMVGENGLHDTLCTVCGKRLDCAYTETVVDPTCTSAGYTVHTCTNCGSSYLDSVVEGGHNGVRPSSRRPTPSRATRSMNARSARKATRRTTPRPSATPLTKAQSRRRPPAPPRAK